MRLRNVIVSIKTLYISIFIYTKNLRDFVCYKAINLAYNQIHATHYMTWIYEKIKNKNQLLPNENSFDDSDACSFAFGIQAYAPYVRSAHIFLFRSLVAIIQWRNEQNLLWWKNNNIRIPINSWIVMQSQIHICIAGKAFSIYVIFGNTFQKKLKWKCWLLKMIL